MTNFIKRVVVGVSGGVDSAVAALLLKQKGFEVIGLFMTNWDENDEKGSCSLSQDREDARRVCHQLGIPFQEANFVKRYWSDVFLYLIREYESGFTPNPDILCNRHIKFDSFLKYSFDTLKADAVATGHYALTNQGPFLESPKPEKEIRLLSPVDTFKDQTFFLSQVKQSALKNVMFPVGIFHKTDVKKIAAKNGLEAVSKKRESTGICFIGDRKFQDFIKDYVPSKVGPMVDISSGKVLKHHEGLHMWTIGQRARIPGFSQQFFVVEKNFDENILYVAPGTNHPSLFSRIIFTDSPHWISSSANNAALVLCKFRFQHTKPLVTCVAYRMKQGGLLVALERPLKSITPGQFAVFYKDGECLGSARIVQHGPSLFSQSISVPEDYEEYEHFDSHRERVVLKCNKVGV